MTGHLGPALDGDFAVLGVERDDDVPGKSRARVLQEAWIFHRRCPDDDVADPEVEIVLDRVQVPDAPAQLHGQGIPERLQDRADDALVLGLAGRRAVEIDDVQPARAFSLPMPGHADGIFGEHRGVPHLSLFQADAVSVLDVKRRNDQH